MNNRLIVNIVCIFMAANAVRNLYLPFTGLSVYNGYEIFLSIVTFIGMVYILFIWNKPYYQRKKKKD